MTVAVMHRYQKAAVDAYFARMPASKLPPTTAYV